MSSMAATTLFLHPSPLTNTQHFPYSCNPFSEFYIPLSLSIMPNFLKNPKPIHSSNPPKLDFSTFSTQPTPSISCTTTTRNDNENNSEDDYKGSIKSRNHDNSFSPAPFSRAGSAIKVPIAPWVKRPLILESNRGLDLTRQRNKKTSSDGRNERPKQSLTDKVSGGRGKKAMKKVFEGIEKLQEHHNLVEETQKIPEHIEFNFPLEEFGNEGNPKFGGKMPWERDDRVVFRRTKKEKAATAAELCLDGVLLERFRGEAARMRKWVKVKKAGVTEAVVDQIHFIWKNNELAMLKFDLPLCRNMDRAREIVEIKTGGLVVWSRKDELVIYRGCNYKLGLKSSSKRRPSLGASHETFFSNVSYRDNITVFQVKSNARTVEEMINRKGGEDETVPINGSLYEREADRLLDGLGPRFVDWWRPKPLPVDADLLPEVVPGYKPPFRLCPPHVRSTLTDDELTYLRKLAPPLPTHFVLGRNRKLQGLAAAILKLWEKCHIAKIAVKWGIPNTDNEQMANELKCLTGGVLLLRNKFFIILYRGKDFLPCGVANLVAERETELKICQLQEEAARLKSIGTFYATDEPSVNTSTSGTLSEFQDIQSECGDLENGNREIEVQLEVEKQRLEKEIRKQERKLFILKMKIERTGKELAKLNSAWRPSKRDADQELLTHEERECFQKIGLKMDSSLVLGRRGVFDGVIEGLHQHWKHREIVKVITMQRVFSQIIYTAKLLEAESGGILISVDKLKEGHAIIIYRGKNYRRPLKLVPQNLLNKREALHKSLELQRIGSLKFFAYQRERTISNLKCKLAELQKEGDLVTENLQAFKA